MLYLLVGISASILACIGAAIGDWGLALTSIGLSITTNILIFIDRGREQA